MITLNDITYLTDYPHKEYNEAINNVSSREGLVGFLLDKRDLHNDAYECAERMSIDDFDVFKSALAIERTSKHDPRSIPFHDITMPAVPFIVSARAIQFKVPWGACFHRMKDLGFIVVMDGIAKYKKPAE